MMAFSCCACDSQCAQDGQHVPSCFVMLAQTLRVVRSSLIRYDSGDRVVLAEISQDARALLVSQAFDVDLAQASVQHM